MGCKVTLVNGTFFILPTIKSSDMAYCYRRALEVQTLIEIVNDVNNSVFINPQHIVTIETWSNN